MGTFRINTGNRIMVMNFIRHAQTNCVNMITKLLTTMAWATVVIIIMMIFALMVFAKIMATPA